ncbi:MAG: hypothetical protein HND44_21215 [Chloroflexi bacterium]|nr:hypothetical protein [Ardenticatenaceae bacterium]MBL1130964.1 hypothetical protein [Chloroflexota bacterium]NOG37062.1 hypothetical protein [Chloroflexota bacterium]GIK57024.1 MAG: hypothetical protein BroJett015_26870 [Chloroflexota bacterium]
MSQKRNRLLRWGKVLLAASFTISLLVSLLLVTRRISARDAHHAPAAGSRAVRSQTYFIDCPADNSQELRLVSPLPDARYLYTESYGWFDTSHFAAGHPAQVLADVEMAAQNGGGIIAISQAVCDGLTGYSAYYLVSGDVRSEDVVGVALGIYMDWSIRFEAWQGRAPRNLVGPFTPFSIEDLPTQYVGFVDATTELKLEALFACYLGAVEAADSPPHLRQAEALPDEVIVLPRVVRLTNEEFQPLVLTEDGWQSVRWPGPLRLAPAPSSAHLWLFESEETWYLGE